jgi:isopentenyl-diphosphate delta-isomerase
MTPETESIQSFEKRKKEHIAWALDVQSQSVTSAGLESVDLIHEAIPQFDLKDVDPSILLFGHTFHFPVFISSMTAGHENSPAINLKLAQIAKQKNWLMGVGSQRRELSDQEALKEWSQIRKIVGEVQLMANIGITQLNKQSLDRLKLIIENLGAVGLFVHTNPLQEALQPEGTPRFSGSLKLLEDLVRAVQVPVVLKEVGCGFSAKTLRQLDNLGLAAIDLAGKGGTHWGRIETLRCDATNPMKTVGEAFGDWGISTVQSVLNARVSLKHTPFWASGGVRSGVDAAKLVAMGAQMVGVAQPLMKAALEGTLALEKTMTKIENEFRIAMFCTGQKKVAALRKNEVWAWKQPSMGN